MLGFQTGIQESSGYPSQPIFNPYMGEGGFIMPSYAADVAATPPIKVLQVSLVCLRVHQTQKMSADRNSVKPCKVDNSCEN